MVSLLSFVILKKEIYMTVGWFMLQLAFLAYLLPLIGESLVKKNGGKVTLFPLVLYVLIIWDFYQVYSCIYFH